MSQLMTGGKRVKQPVDVKQRGTGVRRCFLCRLAASRFEYQPT